MKFNDGVSIIVTVFNKEKYIENTLSSIVKQMNRSSELIIVNDGSTDKSLKKINAFFKKRKISHKLINQTNTGPSIAINNALKKVKFSFVKLVDGDDILAPDAIDFMYKKMKKLDLNLLYGDWKWVDHPEKYKFQNYSEEKTELMINAVGKLLAKGWGGSSNLMIKTESFKKVGGCDENVFVQDFSIPLRVAGHNLLPSIKKKHKIAVTSKLVCVCPQFISNRIMSNNGQTIYDLSIATLNFIDENEYLNKAVKKSALNKIISRCWKWSKRKYNISLFSKEFFIYLKSKFGINYTSEIVRYFVFQTWREENNIRKFSFKPKKRKKILIYVGLDLLGDALLKFPFIKAIKKVFPNSEITWLAGKGNSVFSKSLKPLTKGLLSKVEDKTELGSKLSDFKRTKEFGNYDIIIDTQKRLFTTLIIKKISCKIFISQTANFLFSDLRTKRKEVNLQQQLINLAEIFYHEKLGCLSTFRKNKSTKVVICPGASVEWKTWKIENFIKVAEYIIKKKLNPIFILGPKEKKMKNYLLNYFSSSNIFTSDNPIKTLNFSSKAKFGISNDTGCGHLISTSGIPLITIFGPTNYQKFRPIGNINNSVISSEKECDSKDINSIKPNMVINEIKLLLEKI